MIVDDRTKFGNALTYLVAGADVSAHFKLKLLFSFSLLMPFSVAQMFRLSSTKNWFDSVGNSVILYISLSVLGELYPDFSFCSTAFSIALLKTGICLEGM